MKKSPITGPIVSAQGAVVVMDEDQIDTDRILPARFMRTPDFSLLTEGAFADDVQARADHPFRDRHTPRVLVAGEGFGCGSSREHAPRALLQVGVRAVVAGSFAEIFQTNALAVGPLGP